MKILLADDHAIVREGLKLCFETMPEHEVVAEAKDGYRLLKLVAQHQPDLVVLDIAMPGLNGIEATRKITAVPGAPRVIILSMHGDPEFVAEALRAGARGYVVKASAFDELISAIEAVAHGQTFVSPAVAGGLVDRCVRQEPTTASTPFDRLTTRERQTLQLLAEGSSAKEIAYKFGVTPKTVHTYRNSIMAKLEVSSVAELTKYAIRHGLTGID